MYQNILQKCGSTPVMITCSVHLCFLIVSMIYQGHYKVTVGKIDRRFTPRRLGYFSLYSRSSIIHALCTWIRSYHVYSVYGNRKQNVTVDQMWTNESSVNIDGGGGGGVGVSGGSIGGAKGAIAPYPQTHLLYYVLDNTSLQTLTY